MKKKILFLAEALGTNGAMISLLSLLNALPKEKYEVSLFMFSQDCPLLDKIPQSVRLLPESLPYQVYKLPLKQALLLALKEGRWDLFLYRLYIVFARTLGWKLRGLSLFHTIQGNYDLACCYGDGFMLPMTLNKVNASKYATWVHVPYSQWPQLSSVYTALKQVDMCVPVSEDTGRDLDKVLGMHVPQHIVHNITDAQSCIDRAKEPCEKARISGVHRIVSVGRVTPQKFFDIIPPSAQLLKARNIPFEWYVVGNGDKYEELRQQISDMQLDDCVHFIGARPNPMPWVKSADVVVCPSRFEAWGMTVSEALCLGKAVITSDIPVFAEQITDSVNGLMRKVTPENIADAVQMLLEDEVLRHHLEENAITYPFTKEYIVNEFDELVNKLCNEE